MAAQTGIVIPIQSTDQGKAQIKSQLENLGSQMSALVQHYNDLREQIRGSLTPSIVDEFEALADQRKTAIRNLVETWKATWKNAATQGILPADAATVPALAGFRGLRGDELGTFQTSITNEQAKLDALAAYYHDAQNAISGGQPLPPVPASLASSPTVFGMSPMIVVGLVAVAAYFMFLHNK